jgi:hypothetical protein
VTRSFVYRGERRLSDHAGKFPVVPAKRKNITLRSDVAEALRRKAELAGVTIDEWIAAQLEIVP